MIETNAPVDDIREARLRMARLLADMHRIHLGLAQECRGLKDFTSQGHARAEIDIATEMMEQYLGGTDAFLENMRGRFEARLGLLRRSEPRQAQDPDNAPAHGAFWFAFSRLCAVLRRAGATIAR
ncbi:hypothetical protein ACQW02_26540 [Humitalea sp. 24SJ18S-53]|uniref:hypothetical protein n=1 Tax=Humitalea sp. 24SJ18S-53 TaxID=3422307 RepID=UPI003D66FDAE